MCESNDEVQQTLVEDEYDGIPEDQWKALQEVKGWGEAEVGEGEGGGGGGPGGENEEDAMAPESEETRATTRRASEVHQPVHDDHAPSPAPGASPKDLEGFEGVPQSQREALASIPGWKEEAAAPAVQVAPPPRDHPVNEEEDSEVMGEGGNGKAGEGDEGETVDLDAQETVDPYVDVPIATQHFEDPPVAEEEEEEEEEVEAEPRKMSSDLRDALGRLVSLHRELRARDEDWRAKKRRAVLAYFGFDPSSQAKPLDPIVSRLLGRRTAP